MENIRPLQYPDDHEEYSGILSTMNPDPKDVFETAYENGNESVSRPALAKILDVPQNMTALRKGLSAFERNTLGNVPGGDQLSYMRRQYPDAQQIGDRILYTDENGVGRVHNPKGFDVGDLTEAMNPKDVATGIAGGAALLSAPISIPSVALAGAGAAATNYLFDKTLQASDFYQTDRNEIDQVNDSLLQGFGETAAELALGPLARVVGEVATPGIKKALSSLGELPESIYMRNEVMPDLASVGGNEKGSFGMYGAHTFDQNIEQQALEKLKNVAPDSRFNHPLNQELREETGYFFTPAGDLAFDIDMTKSNWEIENLGKINSDKYGEQWMRLGDIVQNDELYNAYPNLAEITVIGNAQDLSAGVGGSFNPVTNRIKISGDMNDILADPERLKDFKSMLGHEVQHYIQSKRPIGRVGKRGQLDDSELSALDKVAESGASSGRDWYGDVSSTKNAKKARSNMSQLQKDVAIENYPNLAAYKIQKSDLPMLGNLKIVDELKKGNAREQLKNASWFVYGDGSDGILPSYRWLQDNNFLGQKPKYNYKHKGYPLTQWYEQARDAVVEVAEHRMKNNRDYSEILESMKYDNLDPVKEYKRINRLTDKTDHIAYHHSQRDIDNTSKPRTVPRELEYVSDNPQGLYDYYTNEGEVMARYAQEMIDKTKSERAKSDLSNMLNLKVGPIFGKKNIMLDKADVWHNPTINTKKYWDLFHKTQKEKIRNLKRLKSKDVLKELLETTRSDYLQGLGGKGNE